MPPRSPIFLYRFFFFFFFNDPATTEIYTLSLHDALPISSRIAQHDQIALLLEQAAGALLGFLQFPIAVGQRLVMHRDLAQPAMHPAQPHAQHGEAGTGDREQETGADRKEVGIIAGLIGAAARNEAVGA